MHIIHVLREANQVDSVYFLLTAYLEAVWHEPAPHLIPDAVLQLPLRGRGDVESRWEMLKGMVAKGSRQVPAAQRDKITEALAVFRSAAERLRALSDEGGPPMTAAELCAA